MSLSELTKALKEKGLVYGEREVVRKLKNGKLKKVFMASNCKPGLARDVAKYSKISNIDVVKLDKTNEELGTICKKPYSISILGY